tara:strand:+ start:112 stop:282 length:171 start_codon:yes stop_codon:yes gene_type:complete
MNITVAKYHAEDNVNTSIVATIDNKVWYIPLDPANRHYQAIQEWAKIDGNTIAEAD